MNTKTWVDGFSDANNHWAAFVNEPVETERKMQVLVCETNRVACDKIDRMVELKCKLVESYGQKRAVVCCPKFKQGFHPGVWKGFVPVIAASDMYE